MSNNPYLARRLAAKARKDVRDAREAALSELCARLLCRLAESDVQAAIDKRWDERAAYRAALSKWQRMGGTTIIARIGRLYQIAQAGTIHEKKWLLKQLSAVPWKNPPVELIQDSVTYDIQIKGKSLRNTQGRGGSNPYEMKREDIMSVELKDAPSATRAHIKQTTRASYSELTTWIKKALDQIVRVDDMVAKIEDRLHRARASAAQYATTPDGRWMGLGHTGSYPFMDADQLKTFREKEAAALAKGLINAVRPYPT